jgi:hypothetical protein
MTSRSALLSLLAASGLPGQHQLAPADSYGCGVTAAARTKRRLAVSRGRCGKHASVVAGRGKAQIEFVPTGKGEALIEVRNQDLKGGYIRCLTEKEQVWKYGIRRTRLDSGG